MQVLKALISILLSSGLFISSSTAQDIHFSQYYTAPMLINPAFSGIFTEDYKLVSNYKNQWKSISHPFKTIYADMEAGVNPSEKQRLGGGLGFYSDKSGKSRMGITSVNLSFASQLKVSAFNHLSFGLTGAYLQKSINLNDLKWDTQYDGYKHDPNLPSGESLAFESLSYMDVGAGIGLVHDEGPDYKWNVGIAALHLTRPKQSFLISGSDKLNFNIVLHGASEIKLEKLPDYSIQPKMSIMNQGGAFEANLGALVKYQVGQDSRYTKEYVSSFFAAGMFYRWKDALILSAQCNYRRKLTIGLSYDINLSPLRQASSARGGMEISLQFTGFFKTQTIK